MLRFLAALIGGFIFSAPAFAIEPFPPSFHTEEIKTNGTTLHVRIGGQDMRGEGMWKPLRDGVTWPDGPVNLPQLPF